MGSRPHDDNLLFRSSIGSRFNQMLHRHSYCVDLRVGRWIREWIREAVGKYRYISYRLRRMDRPHYHPNPLKPEPNTSYSFPEPKYEQPEYFFKISVNSPTNETYFSKPKDIHSPYPESTNDHQSSTSIELSDSAHTFENRLKGITLMEDTELGRPES